MAPVPSKLYFMSNLRAPLAEFIGTFFLCFAGIAAILGGTQAVGSNVGLVGIALAHGLALSVAIATFGGVSGAHFNPAVTIALLATNRVAAPTALTPGMAPRASRERTTIPAASRVAGYVTSGNATLNASA